jgi:hypothetical protein
MMGGGLCWLDYDEDGWLDLFVVNSYALAESDRWQQEGGLPRSALFHNVGGEFVDVSSGSEADLDLRGNGCVAADFDLDGHTDLYVTTATVGALLWNEGDGTFTEGTEAAGVQAFGWYAGAAVGDVDGNGWPDLFLSGYANVSAPIDGATQGFPNTNLGVRDLLYLNEGEDDDGRVRFREVGMEAGLEVVGFEYGLGAMFSDLDRDGDLDLYLANDTKPNRLYDNVPWPGGAEADPAGLGFRFEELAGRAGAADPNAGMGVAEADYDGDGLPDLFVTNARGQVHAAYHGQISELVDPSFADVRADLGTDLGDGTGWGVSFADLDLDTDLDLFLVNGDVPVTDLTDDAEPLEALGNLTAQGEPGRFDDIGDALGLGAIGPMLARGSAVADYDNDGDLDVAINSTARAAPGSRRGSTGSNPVRWLPLPCPTVASSSAKRGRAAATCPRRIRAVISASVGPEPSASSSSDGPEGRRRRSRTWPPIRSSWWRRRGDAGAALDRGRRGGRSRRPAQLHELGGPPRDRLHPSRPSGEVGRSGVG